MSKSVTLLDELVPLLIGASKSMALLPTQRRTAIHFRYSDDLSDVYSMHNQAAMLPSQVDVQNKDSSTYRACRNTPSDSWEIEVCVGIVIQLIIAPNWELVQRLGRSLTVLKVHKQPPVCELFFMPRDTVVETYKDRMPKTLEWLHMYDPMNEIAFWAELYQPKNGASRAGSRSWLTDELCGAFGSRYSLPGHLLSPEKIEDTLRLVTSSREEVAARAEQAQKKLEKNRAKKERQKARKAELRQQHAEEERQRTVAEEEAEMQAAKAAKMPAPMLDMAELKRNIEITKT